MQTITGRMHQIRIHLACLKAPIVADLSYGGEYIYLSSLKKRFNLKKRYRRAAINQAGSLHAFALKFTDMQGEVKEIQAPYPKDYVVLLKQLEING